jgi:hypothetical protein
MGFKITGHEISLLCLIAYRPYKDTFEEFKDRLGEHALPVARYLVGYPDVLPEYKSTADAIREYADARSAREAKYNSR